MEWSVQWSAIFPGVARSVKWQFRIYRSMFNIDEHVQHRGACSAERNGEQHSVFRADGEMTSKSPHRTVTSRFAMPEGLFVECRLVMPMGKGGILVAATSARATYWGRIASERNTSRQSRCP